jgi:hypothetical protein
VADVGVTLMEQTLYLPQRQLKDIPLAMPYTQMRNLAFPAQ